MVVMEGDRQSQSQGAQGAQGAGQGWYEGAAGHPGSPMPSQLHQVGDKAVEKYFMINFYDAGLDNK